MAAPGLVGPSGASRRRRQLDQFFFRNDGPFLMVSHARSLACCHDQKDTADVLLKTVLSHKATLETFLKEPLIIVATLRNRLSKSHGAGTAPKKVPPNRAEYAINATAAAILLLVSECT